jgi:hypothetical protein
LDWNVIINGLLTSSPLTGLLATAIYHLWAKLGEKDKVIQDLQAARIADLKEIAKQDD